MVDLVGSRFRNQLLARPNFARPEETVAWFGAVQAQDYPAALWAVGLPAAEARRALELARSDLERETVGQTTCWLAPADAPASRSPARDLPPHLLPAFDEYLVGYRDRSAVLDPTYVRRVNAGGGLLGPTIALRGRIAGTWKRTRGRIEVSVHASLFAPPRPGDARALELATQEYARFLEVPAQLSIVGPRQA